MDDKDRVVLKIALRLLNIDLAFWVSQMAPGSYLSQVTKAEEKIKHLKAVKTAIQHVLDTQDSDELASVYKMLDQDIEFFKP